MLRCLLSQYLDGDPQRITFQYNPYGKPQLTPQKTTTSHKMSFNLSHSRDYALIVVSHHDWLGVDIEYQHPLEYVGRLVTRFFSKEEARAFFQEPSSLQLSAFYRLWTKKEAWLKAIGKGLSQPLHTFTLNHSMSYEEKWLPIHEKNHSVLQWQLHQFNPVPDYYAAVVWEGHPAPLSFLMPDPNNFVFTAN